ncbi:NifU family protein [Fulvivirga sedimenti]|uniref:NifU family protein n=1 Tax=Fulvivirga sedimenti TaxID=2879465 RepID=A0A9X1L1H8_9BACT|nr:NifU family protein [Fulvivirga sedimenti]MCA6078242.1 NifU family protein [Fulvivirga sedimenti]
MSQTTAKRPVNIYMEANPNPHSMKFVANFMLVPEGTSYDFPDAESADKAMLAQQLFKLPYIRRVFFMNNFITVTKEENIDWVEIREEIKNIIIKYLESGNDLIEKPEVQEIYDESDSETVKKIKTILDEYIKPAVEQDGGAITFHSFQDGNVRVLLQGSCSGCPSSTVTLKAGIENLLKRMVPEVEMVEAIDG